MELLKKTVDASIDLEQKETVSDERYTLVLSPKGSAVSDSDEEGLIEVSVSFRFDFKKNDIFFLNGYQSWTYSPERNRNQFDSSMRYCPKALDKKFGFSQYGDGYFSDRIYRKDLFNGYKKGYSYAYVRRGDEYFLFASLAEQTGFTRISFNVGEKTVTFKKDCHHRALSEGEKYTALDIIHINGSEDQVFDKWFELMDIKAIKAQPKIGYTSWYNYYQNINEETVLRDLEGLKDLPIKPDIFQIDDGFQCFVGDWLDINNTKFPNGIENIIKKITGEGYQAGLWLSPFVCEKESRLFKEHPDWLQYKNGEPVYAGGNWSGAYALDPYNEDLRKYITECVDHYKAMGITLFKLDFLYAACMTSRPEKTRGEIMSESMDFLRKICGDAQILACGVPLASAFGKVEYCRIGPDMSLAFNDKIFMRLFHNERPSTKHTQRNTVYRRQLDGRAFLNDPDVFILREENTSMKKSQKETLALINSLLGSVLFASDDFGKYDEEKKCFFEKLCRLQKAKGVKVKTLKVSTKHLISIDYYLDENKETLELEI